MFKNFIEENIERDIKSFETNADLYERYKMFCRFYNLEPTTILKFGNKLKKSNVGIKHKRMKNRITETGRWGVKLLPCKY